MVLLSNILKEGELIRQEEWNKYIDSLRQDLIISDEKKTAKILAELFSEAVKKRIPKEKFGIFFSGGVDSTAIAYECKKNNADFICYTVGIEGSKDLEFSSIVAKKLGLEHRKKTLSLKELEEIFDETASILKDKMNIVNLGVGAVVLAAIKLAEKDNINIFFSGLGSEELFAGYQRHEKAKDLNEECWLGLKTMWERDFQRDFRIAKATNTTFLTPFLDKELIVEAMKINSELKIKNNIKKYIFRKAASYLGMPEEFSFRPKIAAQYGSSFDKAISRIGKEKGFKFKREYLLYLSNNK